MQSKKKLIGITGGTGCGKSMAAQVIREAGYEVLDADQICREVVLPKRPALTEIRNSFGEDIILPDGTLDRKGLGEIVFSDPEKLSVLNRIMFSYVMQETEERLKNVCGEICFFDAPLLLEYGLDKRCSAVIAVLADREKRIARIMARDGLSRENAVSRINSQNKDEFYLEKSDFVVYNNSTKDELSGQIMKIIKKLREMP